MNSENVKNEMIAEKPKANKVLTKKDIFVVENPQNYSSIGKMVQSGNTSSPLWPFSKSNRADIQKMYISKPLLRNQLIASDPNSKLYYPEIKFRFQQKPQWSFAKDPKESRISPPFAHYQLIDKSSNVLQSFNTTKPRTAMSRFKSAPKVD